MVSTTKRASVASLATAEHLRADPAFSLGIQGFGKFFFGLGNDGVCQAEDGLGGAVILFKLDDPGSWKLVRKTHDIVKICAPETVDGLGIVSDHHHVVVVAGKQADDLCLDQVGVLVLVNQDILKTSGNFCPVPVSDSASSRCQLTSRSS